MGIDLEAAKCRNIAFVLFLLFCAASQINYSLQIPKVDERENLLLAPPEDDSKDSRTLTVDEIKQSFSMNYSTTQQFPNKSMEVALNEIDTIVSKAMQHFPLQVYEEIQRNTQQLIVNGLNASSQFASAMGNSSMITMPPQSHGRANITQSLTLPTNETETIPMKNSTFKNTQLLTPAQINLLLNPPPTNETMNACLFIMDDTIRLLEWLAYHYTVLPLGHLVVAIDPKSKRIDKIETILNSWKDFITVDVYYNDSFLSLGPYEGWGRNVWGNNNRLRGWFKNKKGITYLSQAHKRRQNFFSSFCFSSLYNSSKRGWTIVTDTDEFVTFNVRYPETEDPTNYASVNNYVTRQDVEESRKFMIPFRDLFTNMTKRVTIAQYLQTYHTVVGHQDDLRCIRLPGLTFSSHEFTNKSILVDHDSPRGMDGSLLMTLRQRQHAAKDGVFSKAMLNLQMAADISWFRFDSVLNVHTPNRRMCGKTRRMDHTGSGADYISSLFRIHHYKAGTVESYLERAGDWRGGGLWRFYFDRNVNTLGENSDLVFWFKWFVDKVGADSADRLLLQPLNDTYNEIGTLRHIKEAKEKIAQLIPNLLDMNRTLVLKEPTLYNRTNHTISACMYIRDDSLRLMEWLAYHYTVLPLSHLTIGLDPKSQREENIDDIIQIWDPFVKIEKFTRDSWLVQLSHLEGWERSLHPDGDNKTILDWFFAKTSEEFIFQEHRRRKNAFIAKCLRSMKDSGRDWVLVADSDEFLIFNYLQNDEDPTSDASNLTRSRGSMNETSLQTIGVRKRLPPLEEHVTIADFIHGENLDKCFRLPSLNFSAHQDKMTRVELPPPAQLLLSLRQHRTGHKKGILSKFILDVSQASYEFLNQLAFGRASGHDRAICSVPGRNDDKESPLRFNHYSAGSAERYAERGTGVTSYDHSGFINKRHFSADGESRDVDYWIDWFIKKVGIVVAERILFKPLLGRSKELSHKVFVKGLKATLTTMGILPTEEKATAFIDDEGNVDEEDEES